MLFVKECQAASFSANYRIVREDEETIIGLPPTKSGRFIQRDADFAANVVLDHIPGLLDMFKWEGKQYVLPEQYAGVVLYYNTKLFQEAGVAPPPADWNDASWTWDKFLQAAQALTKKDASGRITQYGFVDAWWPPLSAMVWATGNGGNWFDQYVKPTKSTLTDPKMVEGVQFFADLSNKHHVAPTAEETQTQTAADLFTSGKAAMALVGHWFYPAFSTAEGLEFDVGVFPRGPQGTTPKSDLGVITGIGVTGEDGPGQAASALRSAGCKSVVLTLGGRGAWLSSELHNQLVPGHTVKVVDTTAAGDAFCAGLAVALAEGQNLHDAVSFGNAVGALATTVMGTSNSMPLRAALDEFLATAR